MRQAIVRYRVLRIQVLTTYTPVYGYIVCNASPEPFDPVSRRVVLAVHAPRMYVVGACRRAFTVHLLTNNNLGRLY